MNTAFCSGRFHVSISMQVQHAASAPWASPKITIKNLEFFYGDARALKAISLSLYANKTTAFIGPSGCGKFDLAAHPEPHVRPLSRPARDRECCSTARTCSIASVDINLLRPRRHVFQKPTPFPMSIYENIAFGIRLYEPCRAPRSTPVSSSAAPPPPCGMKSRTSSARPPRSVGRPAAALCIARTVAVKPE